MDQAIKEGWPKQPPFFLFFLKNLFPFQFYQRFVLSIERRGYSRDCISEDRGCIPGHRLAAGWVLGFAAEYLRTVLPLHSLKAS